MLLKWQAGNLSPHMNSNTRVTQLNCKMRILLQAGSKHLQSPNPVSTQPPHASPKTGAPCCLGQKSTHGSQGQGTLQKLWLHLISPSILTALCPRGSGTPRASAHLPSAARPVVSCSMPSATSRPCLAAEAALSPLHKLRLPGTVALDGLDAARSTGCQD